MPSGLSEFAEVAIPVAVHGSFGTKMPTLGQERYKDPFFFHLVCHPWEMQGACLDVVCGGVLSKFPGLKVAFLESGIGWVPWFMARLDGDFKKMPQDEGLKTGLPSDYLRGGNCFFACDPDEATLPYVASVMGEDTIIYASDYPHWDARYPNSVRLLAQRDDLTAGLKRKILCDNGRRLYNL